MQGVFGVFIGTFLIGLREGLEAALIVSIVAAFLKRNGQSTRPLVAGVTLAVLVSAAVGVGLDAFAASLPQARQEAMEAVIDAVAVVFVTSMIVWMNTHSARLKGGLERDAQRAMSRGGALALAVMAFLAVLKEGFETSVFLLAAAQTSHGSRWAAALGGASGIAVAIGLGAGLYAGGLRLNLGRFFRITGVFLVLIAAGLVLGALRSGHEAGWVNLGQQRVLDLSRWIPPDSVPGALITGMFGIPADPRLVELLGWAAYAVPVLIVFCWPDGLAAAPRTRARVLTAAALTSLVAAALLTLAVPAAHPVSCGRQRVVSDQAGRTARVAVSTGPQRATLTIADAANVRTLALSPAGEQAVDGVGVRAWQATAGDAAAADAPPTVTLEQLVDLTGGRLPVGVSAARTSGAFRVQWNTSTVYSVLAAGDCVVSARASTNRTATLTGGGLAAARTVSIGGLPTDWSTTADDDRRTAAQLAADRYDAAQLTLWAVWLPLLLGGLALLCGVRAVASTRRWQPPRRARKETG